jgi:hypothetical protein
MVQLMRSDSDNNHFYKKVKLESQQQDDVPNKRPKFDFNLDSSPKVLFFFQIFNLYSKPIINFILGRLF